MGADQSMCEVLNFKLTEGSTANDLSLRLHYTGIWYGKVSVELLPNKFFQERELATELELIPQQYRTLPFRRTLRPDAKLINREANSTVRVCTNGANCCDYYIDESKYLDFPVMSAPEMVTVTKEAAKRSVPPTVLMLGAPGGGKSTLTNELIALLEGKPCGQVFHAPTCGFGSTCTIVLHNIMASLPGQATVGAGDGNGGRVRFIDPPGIGPNAKAIRLGIEEVEWMLQGKVEAGSSLEYDWRGDNDDEGKKEMHPHVALVLVKVADLIGGMDEWTVKIVPQVVKKANDYGVRVMVVLTYPNYVWPDGPSQVPDADRARVLAKAQATLGVQSRDAFFFWPYLDASESRHVVKEATTAAILAGALERAIPRMDDRERAAKEARRKAAAEQERKLQEEAKQEEERRKAAAEQKKKQEEEAAKQEAERIQREAEAERLRAQAAKKEEERIQQEAKAESARVQAAKDMADEATRDAQRIRQEAEQALAELRAMQQRLMEQMKNATQDTVKSKQPPWGIWSILKAIFEVILWLFKRFPTEVCQAALCVVAFIKLHWDRRRRPASSRALVPVRGSARSTVMAQAPTRQVPVAAFSGGASARRVNAGVSGHKPGGGVTDRMEGVTGSGGSGR